MSRPPIVVVTGTDTDVGKTVVTAALAAAQPGRTAVVKPVQTGVSAAEPGDLDVVRRLTGHTDLHEGARLVDPLAPTTAARRQGAALPSVAAHAAAIDELAATRDRVLVEGAGGLLVGLDDAGRDLTGLAASLTVPSTFVVVCRAGLGTLNHTRLTAEPGLAERCNREDLPTVTGVPLLGRLPARAGALARAEFTAAAPGWFGALP